MTKQVIKLTLQATRNVGNMKPAPADKTFNIRCISGAILVSDGVSQFRAGQGVTDKQAEELAARYEILTTAKLLD